jgi:hypothetical protein
MYRHPTSETMMDRGNAFLKSQIDNAVTQHGAFLSALEAHEEHAEDPRFSDLCARDAFRTFREAGKMMGNRTLQEIGDIGERRHDAYVKEASRLVQHMFVEHVQGVDGAARKSAFTRLDATT